MVDVSTATNPSFLQSLSLLLSAETPPIHINNKKERKARPGKPGEDRQIRTGRTGEAEEDKQNMHKCERKLGGQKYEHKKLGAQ